MCRQCRQNCASCVSAEECDSCQPGMYLVQVSDDPKHLHHGKCMEKCPNGFYASEEPAKSKNGYGLCLHLQSSSSPGVLTTCTVQTCTNPSMCPAQHYCSTESCCEPCDSSCITCAGPGPTQCSACPPETTLQDGACLQLDCMAGQYKANDKVKKALTLNHWQNF